MFKKEKIGKFNKKPIYLFHQKKGDIRCLLVGGMHHYENTTKHLENLIGENPPIFRRFDLYVIPNINPANFLGLNRCFNYRDIPLEYRFLKDLNPFDLAIDFHADFEGVRFYIFERRKPKLRNLSQPLFRKLLQYVPVRGYERINHKPEHTLEELNFRLGSSYSLTTETPNSYFRLKRSEVKFNEVLTKTILKTYIELMEKK